MNAPFNTTSARKSRKASAIGETIAVVGLGYVGLPVAVAIAGGVLLSTVVSFYFTPPVFALVRRRTRSAAKEDGAAPVALAPYQLPRVAAE